MGVARAKAHLKKSKAAAAKVKKAVGKAEGKAKGKAAKLKKAKKKGKLAGKKVNIERKLLAKQRLAGNKLFTVASAANVASSNAANAALRIKAKVKGIVSAYKSAVAKLKKMKKAVKKQAKFVLSLGKMKKTLAVQALKRKGKAKMTASLGKAKGKLNRYKKKMFSLKFLNGKRAKAIISARNALIAARAAYKHQLIARRL